jgi:hypothetical protein
MVGRFLEINNDRYYETYLKKGSDLMKQVNIDEQDNQQTEREILSYRPLNYYKNLLNETQEGSNQYLFLAMLTLQPPLRSSFYNTCQFIFKNEDDDKENES